MVGTPRCGVPARNKVEGGTDVVKRMGFDKVFRRLTLRSATETAQRAVPTLMVGQRHKPSNLTFFTSKIWPTDSRDRRSYSLELSLDTDYRQRMILVTSSQAKNLLSVSYIGRVRLADFQKNAADFTAQMATMPKRYNLLSDFSQLDSMDLDCAAEMGRLMKVIGQSGAGLIVRVIPDPSKDIGMNILTAFHFRGHPTIVTCQNMREAMKALGF